VCLPAKLCAGLGLFLLCSALLCVQRHIPHTLMVGSANRTERTERSAARRTERCGVAVVAVVAVLCCGAAVVITTYHRSTGYTTKVGKTTSEPCSL
jgi:ABC-type Fe3+ transport system permease subunit